MPTRTCNVRLAGLGSARLRLLMNNLRQAHGEISGRNALLQLPHQGALKLMKMTIVALIAVLAFGLGATAQELAGIGVDFTRGTNQPVMVYSVHPGSPAEKAGIQRGCFLISVDGTNVVSIPLERAAKMVRGRVGTSVTIQVADANLAHTNSFEIKRSRIVIVDNKFQFIDH